MLGKQRERANKRNKLTVAQPYPVMHVLDIPLKCRPVMRKSSINLVCASHPGWKLWQITSANGQKMNDNTSFYCVILELTAKEVANTRLSHESQSLPQTSKSLTHAARMCICDPNLDNKDLWKFEKIENNICAIEFHDRTLSSEMSIRR